MTKANCLSRYPRRCSLVQEDNTDHYFGAWGDEAYEAGEAVLPGEEEMADVASAQEPL